jgi:hypothetical protein
MERSEISHFEVEILAAQDNWKGLHALLLKLAAASPVFPALSDDDKRVNSWNLLTYSEQCESKD